MSLSIRNANGFVTRFRDAMPAGTPARFVYHGKLRFVSIQHNKHNKNGEAYFDTWDFDAFGIRYYTIAKIEGPIITM